MASHTPPRTRRIRRGRVALHGTSRRPRIAIQRTAKHFRAQAIDDDYGTTLLAIADDQPTVKLPKTAARGVTQAAALGQAFASAASTAKLTMFVFDRRGYRYHGRVKAFVEALRAAGLTI